MTADVSNRDDVIDSRDVIARIEELESERETLADAFTECDQERQAAVIAGNVDEAAALTEKTGAAQDALDEWDSSPDGEELRVLRSLAEEAADYCPDWRHGATLIRDSYFTNYAEELVKDSGDMPREIPSYIKIDWKATAKNIKVDYTSVDFDGVTYWVR